LLPLEEMYHASKAKSDPALETKGCSTSTVQDFLSAIASRLDDLSMQARLFRDGGGGSAFRSGGNSSRKMQDVFDAFLKPPVDAELLEAEQPTEMAKKMLPSMSDQLADQDGENDPKDEQGARKGAIDRRKRDEVISAWVNKQKQVRGAMTARPTIRQYYESEASQRPKKIYAPASAR